MVVTDRIAPENMQRLLIQIQSAHGLEKSAWLQVRPGPHAAFDNRGESPDQ